jgi:hypothetical protein
MPQAAPQAQQKTMDEAMQETIAAHEDGHDAAPEAAPEAEAEPVEQTPAEAGGEQAEAKSEEAETPLAKQATPAVKTPAKEAKDGKQSAPKPIPALSAWPPHLRDQFHALPRPVKDQIIRSYGDFTRGLAERDRQITAAKQQVEAAKPITEALAPFMPHLQAVGVAPGPAVRNLFQTEYVLRTGAEGQKAQIVANLMNTYGITTAALVAVLQGAPAPEGKEPAPVLPQQQRHQEQAPRDPRLDILLKNLERQAQTRQTAQERQDEIALHEFLNSGKAEFFDDVAQDMAELAKLPKHKGATFEQLYEKACLLNDDVRTVLEKRKADEAATQRNQKAQQARRAASSVKTEPGAPQGARQPSLEEALRRDIEAAYGPQAV